MIEILTEEALQPNILFPKLKEKNYLIISKNNVPQASFLVKSWIFAKTNEEYAGNLKGLMDDRKYFFQFRAVALLGDKEIILITK